jgi:small-conductance mechanosensitive channel
MILDWYTVTIEALQGLWQRFLIFFPRLIGAIIIFLIGWFIALGIGKLVAEILKRLQFNRIFEKGTWKAAMEKAEIKADGAGFVGAIVKWVLIIVFLLAAMKILGLVEFAGFLTNVLSYLPNVIVAALIFVVAVIIADLLEKVVRATVESIKVGYGGVAGAIIKWSIWIFAILAILIQLKIATQLILTLFTGFVALVAIAGGLAFGLGGKDIAADILDSIRKRFKE